METYAALRRRRMVRAFEARDVEGTVLARVLEAGRRAPSAGFTQGVELLVLRDPADRAAFWDAETDASWRAVHPDHARTRLAPAIVIPLTGSEPYTRRYSEPDKAGSGLSLADAWPVPFWWVDAGMAVMAMLTAAVDEGLGALFTGVFRGAPALRARFGLPDDLEVVGALLLGWPGAEPSGATRRRSRRPGADQVHEGGYGTPFVS